MRDQRVHRVVVEQHRRLHRDAETAVQYVHQVYRDDRIDAVFGETLLVVDGPFRHAQRACDAFAHTAPHVVFHLLRRHCRAVEYALLLACRTRLGARRDGAAAAFCGWGGRRYCPRRSFDLRLRLHRSDRLGCRLCRRLRRLPHQPVALRDDHLLAQRRRRRRREMHRRQTFLLQHPLPRRRRQCRTAAQPQFRVLVQPPALQQAERQVGQQTTRRAHLVDQHQAAFGQCRLRMAQRPPDVPRRMQHVRRDH